jgi:hypothetical protein
MGHLSLFPLQIRRAYLGVLIFLVVAVLLGAVVGAYWRAEYAQCLAVSGGFQKIIAGTCTLRP